MQNIHLLYMIDNSDLKMNHRNKNINKSIFVLLLSLRKCIISHISPSIDFIIQFELTLQCQCEF